MATATYAPLPTGKKPFRPDNRDLKLSRYLDLSVLPTPPATIGHEKLVTIPWGGLGNFDAGDCVFAGGGHNNMIVNAIGGHPIPPFTDKCVLADYSLVTGYNPNDPNTDQGAEIRQVLSWRRSTGLQDATGKRHKLTAYAGVDYTSWPMMKTALWLFGAVEIGLQLPQSAVDQFQNSRSWTYQTGSPVVGGHDVLIVARRNGRFICVTWGRLVSMSDTFLHHYLDEAWVSYWGPEFLTAKGTSLEGFNQTQLMADLRAIAH